MSKIIAQYQKHVASGQLVSDPLQVEALALLSDVALQLERDAAQKRFFWQRQAPIKGVYLLGPVGRGKSMLMDLFFEHTAIESKQRLHFHHFMAWVQQRLCALQGIKNPMEHIAKDYAKHTRLLCFDEFFVTDIGDAMIMARLFSALFKQGLTLVATSNCAPSELYRNGLQRSRFLPTIELIQSHCTVFDVSGQQDYRLHGFAGFTHYFDCAQTSLITLFGQRYCDSEIEQSLKIHHRDIHFQGLAAKAGCIDFFALCGVGRASSDYMALAQRFDVLYVSDVPTMGATQLPQHTVQGIEEGYIREHEHVTNATLDDEARRFIALVDEFYDNGKLLVLSAQCDIYHLYQGERLAFEFERTQSRLIEMQRWSL